MLLRSGAEGGRRARVDAVHQPATNDTKDGRQFLRDGAVWSANLGQLQIPFFSSRARLCRLLQHTT